jgi:hypothetical protein
MDSALLCVISTVAPVARPKRGGEIIEQPSATSKIPMERRTRDLKDMAGILSVDSAFYKFWRYFACYENNIVRRFCSKG